MKQDMGNGNNGKKCHILEMGKSAMRPSWTYKLRENIENRENKRIQKIQKIKKRKIWEW